MYIVYTIKKLYSSKLYLINLLVPVKKKEITYFWKQFITNYLTKITTGRLPYSISIYSIKLHNQNSKHSICLKGTLKRSQIKYDKLFKKIHDAHIAENVIFKFDLVSICLIKIQNTF